MRPQPQSESRDQSIGNYQVEILPMKISLLPGPERHADAIRKAALSSSADFSLGRIFANRCLQTRG
jgi:hypothetical protein